MRSNSIYKPLTEVKIVELTFKDSPKITTSSFSRRGQLPRFIGVVGVKLMVKTFQLRKLIRHRVRKLMEAKYLENLQMILILEFSRLEKGFQKELLTE